MQIVNLMTNAEIDCCYHFNNVQWGSSKSERIKSMSFFDIWPSLQFIPGHSLASLSQSSFDLSILSQHGYVMHWRGRWSYIEQPSFVRNTQSAFEYSFNTSILSFVDDTYSRVYTAIVSSRVKLTAFAISSISRDDKKTNPLSEEQHLLHPFLHEKLSPSL